MILDASFVVALLFEEPNADACQAVLERPWNAGDELAMGTVNLAEVFILFRSRKADEHERLEAEARVRYARLNSCDTFAYALAKSRGDRVLTLDADFVGLDIETVIP